MSFCSVTRFIGVSSLLIFAGWLAASPASSFRFEISDAEFAPEEIDPLFSRVRNFRFAIDLAGAPEIGRFYKTQDVELVQYQVFGRLSVNPPTPSGFSAFRLRREPGGEGPIVAEEWIAQGSSIGFEIASSANLLDGLQLSELVPDSNGLIFALDAREFERLDRARYHPPQLFLYADGTGFLRNSNNSSGSTGTTNPGTGLTVDVEVSEEYKTELRFDPNLITVVVPEPSTALLLGIGLILMHARRPESA